MTKVEYDCTITYSLLSSRWVNLHYYFSWRRHRHIWTASMVDGISKKWPETGDYLVKRKD